MSEHHGSGQAGGHEMPKLSPEEARRRLVDHVHRALDRAKTSQQLINIQANILSGASAAPNDLLTLQLVGLITARAKDMGLDDAEIQDISASAQELVDNHRREIATKTKSDAEAALKMKLEQSQSIADTSRPFVVGEELAAEEAGDYGGILEHIDTKNPGLLEKTEAPLPNLPKKWKDVSEISAETFDASDIEEEAAPRIPSRSVEKPPITQSPKSSVAFKSPIVVLPPQKIEAPHFVVAPPERYVPQVRKGRFWTKVGAVAASVLGWLGIGVGAKKIGDMSQANESAPVADQFKGPMHEPMATVPDREPTQQEDPAIASTNTVDVPHDAIRESGTPPPAFVEVVKKDGSIWESARKLVPGDRAFSMMWENPKSIVEIDGEKVPLHEVDIVHKGDKVKAVGDHFELETSSGQKPGRGLREDIDIDRASLEQ